MARRASSDVLFRVAGGPRVGFGHVLRALALARALGVVPRISLRGNASTRRTVRLLGAVVDGCQAPHDLDPRRTRVLVVDDPSVRAARVWVRLARLRGIRVVSVHDLGLAPVPSDLAIDGSVAPGYHVTAQRVLLGPRYAVLDLGLLALKARRRSRLNATRDTKPASPRVVVSLGGGVRATLAWHLAHAIHTTVPEADVRVAAGFTTDLQGRHASVRAIAPRHFRRELAQATAAVLAGGVSLYEACALGVPTVAVSVVPAQRRTVRQMERLGAAIDAGPAVTRRSEADRLVRRIAETVAALLARPEAQQKLARRAGEEIDGRGAERVAEAIRALRRDPPTSAAA